jgi:hypothetical protein
MTQNIRLEGVFYRKLMLQHITKSRNFNVSQSVLDDTASPEVVALPSVLPTSTSGSNNGTNPNETTPRKNPN